MSRYEDSAALTLLEVKKTNEFSQARVRSSLARGSAVMPNRRRSFVPGVSLHVRQRGNNRCAIFGDDEDLESYLLMLESATRRHRVAVHGYCLMTTHTHILLTPRTTSGPAKAMLEVGVRYVLYFNRKYRRVGTLWTGRYKAKPITDERYWLACLRYIEQNPVRAGLVVRPGQYRWSSYGVHALGRESHWLATHSLLEALGANPAERQAAYKALCDNPLRLDEKIRQQFTD
jgi:putative transposase